MLSGFDFVRPVDVEGVAVDALAHRLELRPGGGEVRHAVRSVIWHIINHVLLAPK